MFFNDHLLTNKIQKIYKSEKNIFTPILYNVLVTILWVKNVRRFYNLICFFSYFHAISSLFLLLSNNMFINTTNNKRHVTFFGCFLFNLLTILNNN